jgi:uncharacterized DUF497 family protein
MNIKGRSFDFDEAKDARLRDERGIGFDDIVQAIERGVACVVSKHPNTAKYPHQMMLEIVIDRYGYAIPFVIQDDGSVFMKTIYPSRKATKKFKGSAKT